MVKWETMWEGPDSQDVGLEAALRNQTLIPRIRNRRVLPLLKQLQLIDKKHLFLATSKSYPTEPY